MLLNTDKITKTSSIIAKTLLPQNGGNSEKERHLSELNIAPYWSKLSERLSSQTSESLRKLFQTAEVKELIAKMTFFLDLAWEVVDERINNDYQKIMEVAINVIRNDSSLHLNNNLKIPKHQRMTNIHRMPGGYLVN